MIDTGGDYRQGFAFPTSMVDLERALMDAKAQGVSEERRRWEERRGQGKPTDSSEILACPFCGSRADLVDLSTVECSECGHTHKCICVGWVVRCSRCQVSRGWNNTQEGSVEIWNLRGDSNAD